MNSEFEARAREIVGLMIKRSSLARPIDGEGMIAAALAEADGKAREECARVAMECSERYAEAARGFSQGDNPMYMQGQADVLKWLAEKLRPAATNRSS